VKETFRSGGETLEKKNLVAIFILTLILGLTTVTAASKPPPSPPVTPLSNYGVAWVSTGYVDVSAMLRFTITITITNGIGPIYLERMALTARGTAPNSPYVMVTTLANQSLVNTVTVLPAASSFGSLSFTRVQVPCGEIRNELSFPICLGPSDASVAVNALVGSGGASLSDYWVTLGVPSGIVFADPLGNMALVPADGLYMFAAGGPFPSGQAVNVGALIVAPSSTVVSISLGP
jgi:hypothetical protein